MFFYSEYFKDKIYYASISYFDRCIFLNQFWDLQLYGHMSFDVLKQFHTFLCAID
jgi:hypothetical protein